MLLNRVILTIYILNTFEFRMLQLLHNHGLNIKICIVWYSIESSFQIVDVFPIGNVIWLRHSPFYLTTFIKRLPSISSLQGCCKTVSKISWHKRYFGTASLSEIATILGKNTKQTFVSFSIITHNVLFIYFVLQLITSFFYIHFKT